MTTHVHKDRDPADTIEEVRRILHQVGIFPYESKWHSASEQAFSVRVEDSALGFGVNGKGVTRPYALASAYGEFIERIQNLALIRRDDFGLMTHDEVFYPDARRVSFSELWRRQPDVMGHLVSMPVPESVINDFDSTGVVCAPFYNVTKDRVDLLPLDFIELVCGSNGLCAGNTPAEALVQGLSEVAERFVTFRIFLEDDLAFPVVPRARFAHLDVNDLVSSIEARSARVVIKDCSCGGRLPVLAALVEDLPQSQYIVCLGAEPCFETALERCITEAFQGASDLSSKGKPFDLCYARHLEQGYGSLVARRELALFRALFNTDAHYPDWFFLDRGTPALDRAFLPAFTGFPDSLRFLVELFHRDNRTIYIRDVAFLGFPAYRVYVPGMTESTVLNRTRPLHSPSELAFMVRSLARLADCPMEDLGRLLPMVEDLARYPLFDRQKWRRRVDPRLHLAPTSDFATQFWGPGGAEKFLALGYTRLGDHARAAHYWEEYVANSPATVTTYERCCLAFLRLRAQGVPLEQVRTALGGLFDRALVDLTTSDFADGNPFRMLRLPRCGGACMDCPSAAQCLYPEWRTVRDRLHDRAHENPRDQSALRELFDH